MSTLASDVTVRLTREELEIIIEALSNDLSEYGDTQDGPICDLLERLGKLQG